MVSHLALSGVILGMASASAVRSVASGRHDSGTLALLRFNAFHLNLVEHSVPGLCRERSASRWRLVRVTCSFLGCLYYTGVVRPPGGL